MVAYGGLGIPMGLTPSQKAAIQGLPALPPNIPESLLRFSVFFETVFLQCLHKNGYDPTKHFSKCPLLIETLRWEAENRK
jgi:hypothetical protein